MLNFKKLVADAVFPQIFFENREHANEQDPQAKPCFACQANSGQVVASKAKQVSQAYHASQQTKQEKLSY